MSIANPLPFLRSLGEGRRVPAVILLVGPQAFLREYILDAVRARLAREGVGYSSFQVGATGDFSRVIEELVEPGLFASRKLVASCAHDASAPPTARSRLRGVLTELPTKARWLMQSGSSRGPVIWCCFMRARHRPSFARR